jgi:glycopeptide antibiotics resistance protein
MNNRSLQPPRVWSQWSNRILILSLLGIIYFTCFPFRIDLASPQSRTTSPFLLGPSLKHGVHLDFLLNVLLFIPFGFGFSALLRKRGISKGRVLILAFAAGAITSYAVEFLQFYIPTRNSAWDDVTPNTLGAAFGFLLFNQCSEMLLNPLTVWEEKLEEWFSLRRASIFLVVYLGFFFLLSIPLQRETRPSNWDPDAPMFVGSDGTARHAWNGQIAKLQVWNRALSEESARKLTSGEFAPGTESGLLASYEFSGAPPFEDREKSLPPLAWISSSPPRESNVLDLNGSSWLSTKTSVTKLTEDLQRSDQFTLRAVCTPTDSADLEQFIVYISQVYASPNLTLRRDGADLAFWFRSPLSMHRSFLTWRVRGVFVPGQSRDILVSSDGSKVSLYVDGKKESRNYYLSPGAALAHKFSRIYTFDTDGYLVLYDTLIFCPAGMLLGTIARKEPSRMPAGRFLLFLGLLLPSALYQFILVWVSGKSVSWWEILLCVLLTLLGAWFINADRGDGVLLRVPPDLSLEDA